MASVFSPNKHIEEPASGDYANAWATPVNANWTLIDTCLAGTVAISVTGVTTTQTLALAQYQPPNIVFSGTLTANLIYQVPSGIGGLWHVFNSTTGSFNLTFTVAGFGGIIVPQGQRGFFVSDGSTINYADTQYAQAAAANAQSAAISAAETFAANASNLSSGTVANARLNNVGLGPGVTIAANPGTTPSGSPGQVWCDY